MKSGFRFLLVLLTALLAVQAPIGAQEEETLQDRYLNIYMLIRNTQEMEEAGNKATARKNYMVALKQLEEISKENPGWQTAIISYRIKFCRDKIKELEGAKDANPNAIDPSQVATMPEDTGSTDPDLPQPEVTSVAPTPAPTLNVQEAPEFKQLKAEFEEVKKDLDDVRNKYDLISEERNQLRIQLANANNELSQAKSTSTTEQDVADLMRDNENLKKQLEIAETQLSSLSEKADKESTVALLNEKLEKVRDQLAAQQALNRSYEESTAALKKKLDETQHELTMARSTPLESAAPASDDLSKENDMLRDIIRRQLQEQARRDIAAKLAREELDNLKVKSETLNQQISLLSEPPLELSEETLNMLRLSQPDVITTQAAEAIELVDAAAVTDSGEMPEIATADPAPTDATAEDASADTEIAVADSPVQDDENALPMPGDDSTPGMEEVATTEVVETAEAPSINDNADVASKPRVPEDIRPLAQQAAEFYANGRFDEAADRYEQMIERYPESLYAWSNLGVVRYQQKRYQDASMALQQAVKLSPSDGFSYSILGIVYYQTGQLDEAISALGRAKTLDAENAKTRNYLGIAHAQKGWQESAEKELRKAVEIAPNYGDAHFNLAVIYATQKPPSKELARKHYNTAKRLGVPQDKQLEQLLN